MCAITSPARTSPTRTRLVVVATTAPGRLGVAGASRAAPPRAVFRRRRLAALAALALSLLACKAVLALSLSGASSAPPGRMTVVAERTYVVQPGDTIWGIARAAQPRGDVRPLVDRLAAERRGRPLRVGERIVVP